MPARYIYLFLFIILVPSGCSFYPYALDNFVRVPLEAYNNRAQKKDFRRLGEMAYLEHCQGNQSEFYARGFKEGFADYLYAGGSGEPPATPPWIYRTRHFDTPDGPNNLQDWYAGWRHGSSVARQSGIRDQVLVPIPLEPIERPGAQIPEYYFKYSPERLRLGIQPEKTKADEEELPLPRKEDYKKLQAK